MLVFISWSGPRAKAVARALRDWLGKVIQAARPWFSEQDIAAGDFGNKDISEKLKAAGYGVVCVTPENFTEPWLNYEAGALAERLEGRVCPYVFRTDVNALGRAPLTRLQAKRANKDGTRELLDAINKALKEPLENECLEAQFNMWWPELDEKLAEIPEADAGTPERSPRELAEETLQLVQSIERRTRAEVVPYKQLPTGDILRLPNLPRSELAAALLEHSSAPAIFAMQEYLRRTGPFVDSQPDEPEQREEPKGKKKGKKGDE